MLPSATAPSLAWLVREAWPSPCTDAKLTSGAFSAPEALALTVQSESLIVLGDGIESDRLVITHGQRLEVGVSGRRLRRVADPARRDIAR